MAKERKEIEARYKWDIEAMYKAPADCEADLKTCLSMAAEFERYKGTLGESGAHLAEVLRAQDAIGQKLERIVCYSQQKLHEDMRVAESRALVDKVMAGVARVSEATSFFSPEFAALPEETLRAWQKEEPGLAMYAHFIDSELRRKAHVLSTEQESVLATLSEMNGAVSDVFDMLSDVDFKFGTVKNEKGEDVEVTHGTYIGLMQSKDRRVRKEAYEHMYAAYQQHENALATLYSYNVKQDVIYARLRKYGSAREHALYGDRIPESVYDNLVTVVNKHLPALHRYVALRKKLLGLSDMKMYDMYVPVMERPEEDIPYEEAQKIVLEALKPLGEEYLAALKKGFEDRWADVYENVGKASGAYSYGSYDTYPYVLLNYDDKLEDVFTVIHEMGHSMHSYYSRKEQPYLYAGHSIFTAEVASTCNEALLMRHLIGKAADPKEKAYLLNLWLEQFRTTLFRQTQFAEFEHEAHVRAERGEALSPQSLAQLYGEINAKYYGPEVEYDDQIAHEWSRIPHFYRAYYVYQYATGYSAATALSTRILEKGQPAVDDYLAFLKSGCSDYPIELLKIAGVDMSSPEPVEAAMQRFEALVGELEKLLA